MDIAQEVLAAFQAEHKDQLHGIRAFLDAVNTEGQDAARSRLEEAFRLAHSLKGGARVCDLGEIETLGHLMESMLTRVREGLLKLDSEATAALHQALNAIEDWMAELGVASSPQTRTGMDLAMNRLSALCPTPNSSKPAARTPPAPTAADQLTPATPISAPDQQSIRVRTELLDQILRLTDEMTIESSRQSHINGQLESLSDCIKELIRENELTRRLILSVTRPLGATLETARLSAHLGLLDQRIRLAAKITTALRRTHSKRMWATGSACDRLQRRVRDLRMVSVESAFQGFRKMMRDVARAEGKEVDFRATGMDVLADKSVLEQLKDPLMHLLRNSIAHGIESPDERQRLGKEPVGRVTLDIKSVGQRLILGVRDDGAGIDRQKVLTVAQQGHWLAQSESGESEAAIQQVLFRPGFTTRGEVDRLAGRGMGLSVVQEAVGRLQGEVGFLDAGMCGTAIEINVPLTICTHRVLVVSCNRSLVCIPLKAVDQLLRMRTKDVTSVEGKPAIELDGRTLQLHNLGDILGERSSATQISPDVLNIVILQTSHVRRAVAVDRFVDEREVIVQRIGGPAGDLPEYAGAVLLEDGAVGLLVNVAWLVEAQSPGAQTKGSAPMPATKERRDMTILIADDSFTTRTLERSILETRGYQVKLAVDGVDALSQLRSDQIDLVVSDVQMPRMNGFRLLEKMKRDERLSRIPIILVTSMDQREHREQGLNLGADAYIVKQKFDHDELLATIERLIHPA